MATRRMRIKAVINVPRGGIKSEPQEQPPHAPVPVPTPLTPSVSAGGGVSSPAPPPPASSPGPYSPRNCSGPMLPSNASSSNDPSSQILQDIPSSPGPPALARSCTPPVSILDKVPSSPKSPASSSASSWQLQRPSPTKSPAGLPPSGSILRRSPSPAVINTQLLTSSSPGPQPFSPSSPVKSPGPFYSSSLQPNTRQESLKFISAAPVVVLPTTFTVSLGERPVEAYPTVTSPTPSGNVFRPPPSPSPSHTDFHGVKSPPSVVIVGRPPPSQSPVYGVTGMRTSSSSFLSHHFSSNSNSADSHEVAALMSTSNIVPILSPTPSASSFFPHSPEKSQRHGRDSVASRGSENSYPGGGAFSSVSGGKVCPSFSSSIMENPEAMKRRMEDRKKESQANASKFAQARKEFFEKFEKNGQAPERSKLTMLHFTFYNPPKPGDPDGKSSGKGKGSRSRSRASSICSEASKQEIILEDRKAASAPSSIGSRRTTASSIGSGGFPGPVHDDAGHQSDAGSTASNGSANVPGPRVKVGPDGQLIIDEKSLVVETSESQRAKKQIEDMEIVSGANYAVGSSGFYRYKRSYRRGHDWTEKETIRFYRALNQCGTDFSMMLSLFPTRSRQELKSKFKREDRKNPDMVSKALASCHFDPEEGISSDEELSLYYAKAKEAKGEPLTEKEKLLREENEVEEVICSSEDPKTDRKQKKTIKKQKLELTAEQKKEVQADLVRGPGTGKGKKWNAPVEGFSGRLSPKKELSQSQNQPVKAQQEPPTKIKLEQNTVSAIVPPLLVIEPTAKTPRRKPAVKKNKKPIDDKPATVVPVYLTEGAMGSGLEAKAALSASFSPGVKAEKLEVSLLSSSQESKSYQDQKPEPQEKGRRNRIKAKLKFGDFSKRKRTSQDAPVAFSEGNTGNSSQDKSSAPSTVCDDLFRFDASDPLGFKVLPAPLPVAQETILDGNEEGSEELVIVDLDELNAISRDAESQKKSTDGEVKEPGTAKKSARKRKKSNTDSIPVTRAKLVEDPYALRRSSVSDSSTAAESSSPQANKKVKVLPYRVPGPGGALPTGKPPSDELEIEIELNTSSSSVTES